MLPHIERRCARNGLKLGMLLSRHQKLVCKPFGVHKFDSKPKPRGYICAILPSLGNEEREDLAIIQQLVAESEEQADAIRDPHASTTLNIIASPR